VSTVSGHRIQTCIPVAARDGAVLSTDLYLPREGTSFPVLLCRTIYDNQMPQYVEWAIRFAEAGYAVAIQDCRGRYDSDGPWEPYVHEPEDGFDTLEWIGQQPWCNGNIGTFGISYVGFTQILPAPLGSRYLKAVMPIANQEDNFGHLWIDGAFQLQIGIYFFQMGRRTMQDTSAKYMHLEPLYSRLPIARALDDIGQSAALNEFLSHPTFDSYWKSYTMKGRYAAIAAPAYFVTGWYDNLVHEQFKLFRSWRAEAKTDEARRLTKILVGPWSHYEIGERPTIGDDLGPASEVDLPDLHIRWYDQRLKGVDTGIDSEPPIKIWVMGRNVWRFENEWPLSRAQPTPLYLESGGRANSAEGDGRLITSRPASAATDTFDYDPSNPLPTVGGQSLFLANAGPRDRQEVERRSDLLVYTGDALDEDLEATGPVEVVLYAATSAPDTDFTATLIDVYPDGRAVAVCEGLVRARYRESLEEPRLVMPGEVYEYRISLWETSQVFARGHCIRLEIGSSNFPRYDRNLNTGGPIGFDDEVRSARQVIHHGPDYPSHLLLPVVPNEP
jgi:putative CocE/NonD family hydrolase